MGLIMLVLIGIVPAAYALNMESSESQVAATSLAARQLEKELSDPGIVKVMEALKAEHLATTRVEELMKDPKALEFEKDRAVSASGEPYSTFDLFEPRSMVDRVFDPYPRPAAELVAATTISLADVGGLPVSTTHVLSSGVAGTMWANKSGIQPETVREIALAWILTLPVAMSLSGGLYWMAMLVTG